MFVYERGGDLTDQHTHSHECASQTSAETLCSSSLRDDLMTQGAVTPYTLIILVGHVITHKHAHTQDGLHESS